MFEDIKQQVRDWDDDEEIEAYLAKILNKEAFDRTGLIYGIGHAVYSISDPRSIILRGQVARLAAEKVWTRNLSCMRMWKDWPLKLLGSSVGFIRGQCQC